MKGIWKYKHLLPQVGRKYRLSIGEGKTSLLKSKHIGPSLGLDNLFFKLENLNPSGSYKDRFAAMAVSLIQQDEAGFCLATSSGNTGAALAAYSAVAQIPCLLAIVDGAPEGKLVQMRAYGAETFMIKDFGKDAQVTEDTMELLSKLALEQNTTVQVSAYKYCPLGMQGVQTISYEIAEQLEGKVNDVFVPAGGGGLTLAIARGFDNWEEEYSTFKKPIIHCVQPEGNDTMVSAIRKKQAYAAAVTGSTTAISGLQVPNVLDGNEVVQYALSNASRGHAVTDEEVLEWQYRLAVEEGVFCEPAGAVALAGLVAALKHNEIRKEDTQVCIVTGHGFKDPNTALGMASRSTLQYINELNDLEKIVKTRIR